MKSNVHSDNKKKDFFSYYRKKVFDESNDVCVYIRSSQVFMICMRVIKKKSDVMFHIATCSSILIFKVLDNKFIAHFLFYRFTPDFCMKNN
jgi:hypothetical protein